MDYTIFLHDEPSQYSYTADGSNIMTVDPSGGISMWEARPSSTTAIAKNGDDLQRLVSFYYTNLGEYLIMDPQGRYDANDPAKVTCASYVLEWTGGLEPVAVAQLKQQFYEPGLLAKASGADKDPVRKVPDRSDLHLFPTITVKAAKNQTYDISLGERDNGGVGKVEVFLNGKLVSQKEGVGFFSFDVSANEQYLLPQTQLPAGSGNILSVRASNENGDLTSTPTVLDIGIPEGLKTPNIKLYALCVGTADYAGTAGDLNAPAADARALSAALSDVGQRLLPGHIEVQTLTTGPGGTPPTRAAICQWFAETAKKATSSDIVFVFLSGHGTSKIAEIRDYFYLTMESDPSDLNALSASTGAISGTDLKRMLAAIPASKQVVVLDTCHSGAAAKSLMAASKSVSGDYQRAYESIRETTGTWMLAGSAADQLSYESTSVDHGLLTYALLEAIDKATAEGLRQGSDNQLFLDVDRWLNYAAGRVESLRNEIGLAGIQKPEFKRSSTGSSFDMGVVDASKHGFLGLRAPRPIVIMGTFQKDEEDPIGLEKAVLPALKESQLFKLWTDVAKHPNVFRVAGTYTVSGDKVAVKVFVQKFDAEENRQTLETFVVDGTTAKKDELAASIQREVDARIEKLSKG